MGPDQCLDEGTPCGHSCTPHLTVPSGAPGIPMGHRVEANSTGLAGPQFVYSAECVCGARHFKSPETCQTTPCLNKGTCTETQYGPMWETLITYCTFWAPRLNSFTIKNTLLFSIRFRTTKLLIFRMFLVLSLKIVCLLYYYHISI